MELDHAGRKAYFLIHSPEMFGHAANCLRTHKTFLHRFIFNTVTIRTYFSKGACSKPCTVDKCPTPETPFKKILVANRGITASRIFRACCELDISCVAIYSECDSKQPFRTLANESYLVGKNKSPVDAYLECNEIIKIAKRTCSDAIHPGIGFMAERSDFAEAVICAGLTFIGPSPMVLYQLGNKVCARKAAEEAGIPVVPGMKDATTNLEEVESFALELGFPVILKAAYGGGGTGLCVAHKIEDIRSAFDKVSSQALNTFGNNCLYVEKFINKSRLIEVQLLADMENNIVHLFERDGSLQKQFKKCVSIAPAPCIDDRLRCNMIEAAISFAKHIKYQSVGSVEFLLDQGGKFYFNELNCQLQKDHCATEDITGVDIVQNQIKIAEGKTLADICLHQECINVHGVSLHCAITTHNPENNFNADHGYVQKIRYPEGIGVRVDGSGLHMGSLISAYYEPTIMRLTTTAATFKDSVVRMKRSIKEVRVRGVESNMSFLLNVLEFPDVLEGKIFTTLIEENPSLFNCLKPSPNRGQKLLEYISEVLVNGPVTLVPFLNECGVKPNIKIKPPEIPENMCPDGLRQLLKENGAYWFADYIRERTNVMLCDTTLSNAQQSLLVSRLRTYDMLQIAPFISHSFCDLYALENCGGETFVTCLQHLYESPWNRIKEMREAIPNIPFLMSIRGPSLVGYSNYPDNVVYEFCNTAVQCGIDIFRVCDPLNYQPNIEMCVKAAKQAGGLVEAAIMYTGDISNPRRTKYNLDYYLCIAEQLIKSGIHILAIKDIAGMLRPQAAEILVSKIRDRFCSVPIHIQTTDASGNAVACAIAAAVAGADIVDVAADPMSGLTSQPNMGSVISAFQNTDLDTGVDLNKVYKYNDYWQDVRLVYAPYDCISYLKSADSRVNYHEIPGGYYSNLMFQAMTCGLGNQLKDVQKAYHNANLILGDIIKDMPVSKAVGDLALCMVQKGLSRSDIEDRSDELELPDSVTHYLQGYMGKPDHGYPESFRSKALKGLPYTDERPGAELQPTDLVQLKQQLQRNHEQVCEIDVLSAALFPEYTNSYLSFKEKYSNVDKLGTKIFLVGPDMGEEFDVELSQGNIATIKLLGVSNYTNECSERSVFFEVNGEPRFIYVKDNCEVKKRVRKKANLCIAGQVAAPKAGKVLEVKVKVGDTIQKDQVLAMLLSRSIECCVLAPVSGVLTDIHVSEHTLLQDGDLMFVIDHMKKPQESSNQLVSVKN